jgi:transposase-like protein
MLNPKGMRFPIDVILVCIRWSAAYPLSYRHLEEMMQERGVSVDHSSINRWAIRFLPLTEKMAHKYKHAVGSSWFIDETYIKVSGVRKYLYRAVDKKGNTIDFLLTAKRDAAAARRFFDNAITDNGTLDKVTMDKNGANKAAIDAINDSSIVRQVKYLNNIVEQDHRTIKRITSPMLGFKSFCSARAPLHHMAARPHLAFRVPRSARQRSRRA